MNETKLDEILEEYAIASEDGAPGQVLRSLIEKYPEYAEDLSDFAAARSVIKYAPDVELSAAEEARYGEMGLKALRNFFEQAAPAVAELGSLTEAAKARGLNKSKFAAALELSVSLMMYLEKRRLDFQTIPQAIVQRLAAALETGEEQIAAYLKQPPEFAGASYKTGTRPEEIKPKSFLEAVNEDQQLTEGQKSNLKRLVVSR